MITMHCGFLVGVTFRKTIVVSQISGKKAKLAAVVAAFLKGSLIFKSGWRKRECVVKSKKRL